MSRKILKKIVVGIMTVTMMMAATGGVTPKTASAATVKKSGDFKYVKYKGGVKIKKYTGKAKKLTIPAKIAGKKVVAIETDAFENNKKLRQVKMPDSIIRIGNNAFSGCGKLKKVVLPDELEYMGYSVFRETALKTITIPKGIKKIDEYTFAECKKLKEVNLSEDVKIIGARAFSGCENLTKINLENVEEIEEKAFSNNKSLAGNFSLKNVVQIAEEAFYGCSSITGVEFSDSLQMLGEMKLSNPFSHCDNIKAFEVDVNNANFITVDGVIYNKIKDTIVAYPAKKGGAFSVPDNTAIADYAFSGAKITSLDMGKGITEIGTQAFAGTHITEVNMPLLEEGTFGKWSKDAFLGCKSLKKVVFPVGTRTANNVAFVNCTALTEVVMPARMTDISSGMFFGCTALETVVLPNELKTIPTGCFYGCKSLKNINLDKIEFIEAVSFYGCESLSGVLNLNVNTIMTAAFAKCTNITEVNFNEVTTKAVYATWHEEDIAKLWSFYSDMPYILYTFKKEDMTEIIDEMENQSMRYNMDFDEDPHRVVINPFVGCSKLTKINVLKEGELKSVDGVLYTADMKHLVTYPAGLTGKFNVPYGVEVIGRCAFEGTNISEVICSNTTTSIMEAAFYDSNLNSVTLSKSVNYIENNSEVFEGCDSLAEINVHADNTVYETTDGVLFQNVEKKRSLVLYPSAKKGKTYKVPEKTYVAGVSFSNCRYLRKVYMSGKEKDLNMHAFENCSNIKLYLSKNYSSKTTDIDQKGKFTTGFVVGCKGCKTYVKKNSAFAKKLDKKKIKYYKY